MGKILDKVLRHEKSFKTRIRKVKKEIEDLASKNSKMVYTFDSV
jgi:hypothetical protein